MWNQDVDPFRIFQLIIQIQVQHQAYNQEELFHRIVT